MTYEEARAEAQRWADDTGREVGIRKTKNPLLRNRTVYTVIHLPRAEYRSGWELQCEVVAPMRVKR